MILGIAPQRADRLIHALCGLARVKGWSKSPPRIWQQRRHGKPYWKQDQTRWHVSFNVISGSPRSHRGRSPETFGNKRSRRMVIHRFYSEDKTRLTGCLSLGLFYNFYFFIVSFLKSCCYIRVIFYCYFINRQKT